MQDTQSISTKDLRNNLAEVLEKVAIGGKSYIVYKFGKKKAQLTPIKQSTMKTKKKKVDFSKLPAFGMWRDRKDMKDPAAWVRKIREMESKRIHY